MINLMNGNNGCMQCGYERIFNINFHDNQNRVGWWNNTVGETLENDYDYD